MRRSALLIVPSLFLLALFLTAPTVPPPPVTFTHGVASGDVRPFSAVLWTRVDQEANLTLEVSTDPSFGSRVIRRKVVASAENDFTAKALVAPLKPDDTYFYRFRRGPSVSETGTFRTPDRRTRKMDIRFAYSGDSDGFGVPALFNFDVLDSAGAEGLDFFVYLGDTIYSDSGLRPTGPAQTLDEYRDTYKVNREIDALPDLLKATSTYAIWDDHEVLNDFDGQTVDPTRYANGREAFLEYMPILDLNLPDPACAGDPLFRVFRWGKDVDIIILDERSCRSADVEAQCLGDLAPTLPIGWRLLLGSVLPLPPAPPPGCLDAINGPSRTMLGDLQKALFKAILLHSNARFKFVINELPIQQFFALPYDRWEGYGAERAEILNFIRDNNIDNVVFLTTDIHANLVNEVFIDSRTDPDPIALEFVTGPIGTFTFEQEILAALGPVLGPLAVGAINAILNLELDVDCRHLDAPSYGLVEVDAAASTATITLKDDTGTTLSDQLTAVPCTKAIGP